MIVNPSIHWLESNWLCLGLCIHGSHWWCSRQPAQTDSDTAIRIILLLHWRITLPRKEQRWGSSFCVYAHVLWILRGKRRIEPGNSHRLITQIMSQGIEPCHNYQHVIHGTVLHHSYTTTWPNRRGSNLHTQTQPIHKHKQRHSCLVMPTRDLKKAVWERTLRHSYLVHAQTHTQIHFSFHAYNLTWRRLPGNEPWGTCIWYTRPFRENCVQMVQIMLETWLLVLGSFVRVCAFVCMYLCMYV